MDIRDNSKAPEKRRVLVVDDSAMVRQAMQAILCRDPRLTVSIAADALIALRKIQQERPDVVVTDLEMPRMDGLTLLKTIMEENPIPVVVCSGLATRGAEQALRALEEGAVAIIAKPKLGVREFLQDSALMLLDTVWNAAQTKIKPRAAMRATPRITADAVLPMARKSPKAAPFQKIIAVGASTGGTEALRDFLGAMPVDCPPIVIVQHMPEVFTRAFAERLNRECAIRVAEACSGERLQSGQALIAPGNLHTMVELSGRGLAVKVVDGPLVSRHRPSVDVLFRSVANSVGANAVGVIMTGMGNDGAQGLWEMKQAGAATIAQDKATSVVFGMPHEAILKGAVDFVLPLERIAGRALELAIAGERVHV
jgi:two-component system, chemotaxis family, protein-glutamate methylesterase/glutaminase